MTKKDFIEFYAKKGNVSKKDAEIYVNLFLDSVEELLCEGNEVGFVGWGKWKVQEKVAREVMNPSTKKMMHVPAKKVVKFKIGKLFADRIANS